MIRWNPSIFMDEKVAKRPKRYRRIIERRELVKNCYVVALPKNPTNTLEIYDSRELWFRYYHVTGLEVVGLAATKESALELLCQIVNEVYSEYGEVDADKVREYFKNKD